MRIFGLDIQRAAALKPVSVKPLVDDSQAYNPEGLPFDPGRPLPPYTDSREPIVWAPPVGYNLLYQGSKKPGARVETLRAFADTCYPIRIVIEQLKREMRGLAVDIVAPEGEEDTSQHDELRAWLKHPDGDLLWTDWLNAVLEDVLVIGAVALGRLRTLDGSPAGLRPIDAANIVPVVNAHGRVPSSPARAYMQVLYGLPYLEYSRDQLIYRPFNVRTSSPFGFSPVEQTLLLCTLSVYSTLYHINVHTESTVPAGFLECPAAWSEGKIKDFEQYLNILMADDPTRKHKLIPVAAGTKYTKARDEIVYDPAFDEMIGRMFAWALGVAATPIVHQSSLGKGSEGLSQEALAAGLKPYQDFVEELLDDYVQNATIGKTVRLEPMPLGFGATDYEFEFVEQREEDRTLQLTEDTESVKLGLRTINEIRTARGEAPYGDEYPEADQPLVLTGTGFVPLAQPEPQPVPAALAANSGVGGEEGDAEAQDSGQGGEAAAGGQGDTGKAMRSDLRKWQRKAAADARRGRAARPFTSSAIPPWLKWRIEQGLAAGDVAKTFATATKVKPVGVSTDPAAAALVSDGVALWDHLLRRMFDYYVSKAVKEAQHGS